MKKFLFIVSLFFSVSLFTGCKPIELGNYGDLSKGYSSLYLKGFSIRTFDNRTVNWPLRAKLNIPSGYHEFAIEGTGQGSSWLQIILQVGLDLIGIEYEPGTSKLSGTGRFNFEPGHSYELRLKAKSKLKTVNYSWEMKDLGLIGE